MKRSHFPVTRALFIVVFLIAVSAISFTWNGPSVLAGPLQETLPQEQQHTIQGQVMTDESTPRPVQNAVIVAKRVNGSDTVSTTTGADGSYSLSVPLAVATWSVTAERGDNTVPAEAQAPSGSKLAIFTSGRNPQTRTADFTFSVASSHITGRVLVEGTSQPPEIPVTVTALRLGDAGAAAASAETDSVDAVDLVIVSGEIDPATGAFDLATPSGVYQITVMPSDLTKYLPLMPAPVTVNNGQTHDMGDLFLIPLDLGNKATIAGVVQTTDGNPAPGVEVAAVNIADKKFVRPQDVDEAGAFSLAVDPGTWWVTVVLDGEDPYMPYRADWQTTVTVEAKQVITDVKLIVSPADLNIHGTLTMGEGGPPADDACGMVAAYKKGEPSVYNFRIFTGPTFDLPVVSGAYRMVVTPDPGVSWLKPLLPENCEPGKYMATTEKSIQVDESTSITIPLTISKARIHGQLWDRTQDKAVTDVGGLLMGWSPSLKTYAMAQIDKTTGRGDLRAAEGDWLLAFRVNPDSGYKERPGVLTTTVASGQADVDVQLKVVKASAVVTGTLLDPDGAPVPRAVVSALGIPGGDSDITDKDGNFTLSLNYGAYVVEVFGPVEVREDRPWITPQPVKLVLTPEETPPSLTLQYSAGDATIHGRLVLSGTQSAAGAGTAPSRAVVWASSQGERTRTTVSMPMGPSDEYRLPAIQGREWLMVGAYWDGEQLWTARQTVSVDSADVSLDLTLVPVSQHPAVKRISQAIDAAKALYAELSDGAKLHVPAGALQGQTEGQSEAGLPQLRKTLHFFLDETLAVYGTNESEYPCCDIQGVQGAAASDLQPFPPVPFIDLNLISPAYTLGMVDRVGTPMTDDVFKSPVILRIPYGSSQRRGAGAMDPATIVALKHVQAPAAQGNARSAAAVNEPAGGWEPAANYIVDEVNQEVIIFVDSWGSYALGMVSIPEQVFLPLTIK